jgi:predicted porin
MKKSTVFSSAIALLLMPVAATAGGLAEPVAPLPVVPPQAPVASTDWSGLYVGAHYGTGDFSLEGGQAGAPPPEDASYYGLHVGYLYDLGSFVLGAEAAYSVGTLDESDEEFSIVDLTARAGYDAGSLMPYIFGGISQYTEDGETYDGTVFGAGAAFALTESILLGGEFAQRSYEDGPTEWTGDFLSLRASYKF